jgi:pyruvate-formate lyase
MNIRKNLPEFTKIMEGMTEEEREKIFEENKKKRDSRVYENLMKILDAAMDAHADETLEILALCCFVEPNEIDSHDISFYLDSISELITNEAVLNFFSSLARLGLTNMQTVSKA